MSGAKQTVVGRFFEEVAHKILGGVLARNEEGDVCLLEEGTTVEVKSSGEKSSYGFRLDINQINTNSRKTPFPFSRSWYMFFVYRNNRTSKRGGRSTELARYDSERSVRRYLSQTILWGAIIDIRVVERWREVRPVSEKSILGHLGTKTVDIRCQEVWRLVNTDTPSELSKLGLDPKQFSRVSGIARIRSSRTFDLNFPLTVLLPIAEVRKAERLLGRRGLNLKRVAHK